MRQKTNIYRMVMAAMFLALALMLPFFTGQVSWLGNAICPMHLPVLLCGFICGPWYALFIGFVSPLLRFVTFGMPPIMPTGICMCFELAAYGFLSGILFKALPKKIPFVYVSLISAMLGGRIVWGIARTVLLGFGKAPFGWAVFITEGFVNALPGIIFQLIFIPGIVIFVGNKELKPLWVNEERQ